jgi:hypothetical protein
MSMDVPSRFLFCDFRSKRYDPNSAHKSEKLAQTLLKMGLKDGDEVDLEHFVQASCIMGEKFEYGKIKEGSKA